MDYTKLPNLRGDHVEVHFHKEESKHNGFTISPTQVLRSNAGYYIGHEYLDIEFNGWFPYDRISGYYPTAKAALDDLFIYEQVLGNEEV